MALSIMEQLIKHGGMQRVWWALCPKSHERFGQCLGFVLDRWCDCQPSHHGLSCGIGGIQAGDIVTQVDGKKVLKLRYGS